MTSTMNRFAIGYIVTGEGQSTEDECAFRWLARQDDIEPRMYPLDNVPASSSLGACDLVWLHSTDEQSFRRFREVAAWPALLKSYYERGGKLLCTGFSARLPFDIGIESREAEARPIDIADTGYGRKIGFQGFRGHPLFQDFHGGVYVWHAYEDHTSWRVGYFDTSWPGEGKVVGVEKAYIRILPDSKLVVEYGNGRGVVLSVGGFIHFGKKNVCRLHLERFVRNSFTYLVTGRGDEPVTFWTPGGAAPQSSSITSNPLSPVPDQPFSIEDESGLILAPERVHDEYCEVAGRRCVVMCREEGGIDEVWVHPFRVLRDLEVIVREGDSVRSLKELQPSVEIRPESITRRYETITGTLTEVVSAALDSPVVLIRYRADVREPLELTVTFKSDMRWMWPYREDASLSIHYGYDEGLHALHVREGGGDFYCLFGADMQPTRHLSGQFRGIRLHARSLEGIPTEGNIIYHAATYSLGPGARRQLSFAVAGSSAGRKEAEEVYRSVLASPDECCSAVARHCRKLLESRVSVKAEDTDFNEGYRWALIGTDRFLATTPGMGTGFLAGYGTSESGWNGGHDVSGRPGYAWYFGRDAQWASFAVDAYGDFDAVRCQLELFKKYQDIDGKIFHELTTSGVVHYDAADSTPLYVILAAHYLRASGDREFIESIWPSLRRAIEFLYTTDTDGDGLIENSHVGHGWVESGELFGAHCTLYLAGLWAQALLEAFYMTRTVGATELGRRLMRDAMRVRETIHTAFWNERSGFFNHSKRKDGSFVEDKTVMPAVLMGFRLLDERRVGSLLDEFASNAFSTDWGVRIISRSSPHYNPETYHTGTVWPLFTGWVSLAEYAYGRSTQGFTHLMNNLLLYRHGALGFAEEVLHGERYQRAGVCPHQCWSETSILLPAIEGMVGFKPDAGEKKLILTPRFPLHWSDVEVHALRVGSSRLRMKMERDRNVTRYSLQPLEGENLHVALAPEIADGMRVTRITVNGRDVTSAATKSRGVLEDAIHFDMKAEVAVEINHTGGIGVIPHVPRPEPGDEGDGFRIIKTFREGDSYVVTLEGKQGSTAVMEVRHFDREIGRVEGAELGKRNDDIRELSVTFDVSEQEFVRKNVRIQTG